MNVNTKLEIAVEIMAAKIAKTAREEKNQDSEEIKRLLKERTEMYQGNEEIIDKIIEKYGEEKDKKILEKKTYDKSESSVDER